MFRAAAAIALILAMEWSTSAAAGGLYMVSNATARTFTCGVRREGRSVIDRFVIRSGEEWRQATHGSGRRSLLCDSSKITPRFRMWPGVRYRLVEDRMGRVIVVAAGPVR